MKNFYYFERGFKGTELASNFSSCGNRSAYWYYWEMQTWKVKLRYGNGTENTFNSTLFVQNTTDVAYICTDTAENMYYFWLTKSDQFPTMTEFSLGFL